VVDYLIRAKSRRSSILVKEVTEIIQFTSFFRALVMIKGLSQTQAVVNMHNKHRAHSLHSGQRDRRPHGYEDVTENRCSITREFLERLYHAVQLQKCRTYNIVRR